MGNGLCGVEYGAELNSKIASSCTYEQSNFDGKRRFLGDSRKAPRIKAIFRKSGNRHYSEKKQRRELNKDTLVKASQETNPDKMEAVVMGAKTSAIPSFRLR